MTNASKRAWGFLAVVACAFALAPGSRAQTACQGTVGPDVIVGDITGPANYTATGTLEALSLGTTSCNQGTVGVGWHSNTNQHPVIGGELYRFKIVNGAGHFDMVGLSWLKHGFYAESQTLCCNNCQPTDGSNLGVGCSDPYTGDRNGTQSLLGPRYQVNPHSGYFTYPPPRPSGGNTGRLQVEVGDLEPTNGSTTRYFANAEYVAPDDATQGHNNNNCSYRGITVSGSGSAWTFGFTGSTHRELPAILAWPTCESGVTVNSIQLPGDGLVMIGFKTTNLGNGQFHYEYMLFNMNADLAMGSFSVPIPAGVALSNIEFHDITYRGGDGIGGTNYDGTDWPAVNAGGSLTWATTPKSVNPNANAIRWATAYSFRFDANTAPVTGALLIGTFKDAGSVQTNGDSPGAPGSVGTSFCPGDGTLSTLCPCFNFGATGHGCANSVNTAGAVLTAVGTVSPDTVVFTASGELPTALSIVLQGTTSNPNGLVFGDGVRCVGGTLKRLYVKSAVAGTITAPAGGDLSVTARSAALGDVIPPGATRYYQTYYRDANPTFCASPPGDTFNVTDGLIIVW
jgi:hypothetical protein